MVEVTWLLLYNRKRISIKPNNQYANRFDASAADDLNNNMVKEEIAHYKQFRQCILNVYNSFP